MLPFDGLKIDKALTDHLGRESSLVGSIIEMVKTLGVRVIVEGVEASSQAVELDRVGCEYAQGYFFARPLGPSEAEELIQQQSSDSRQLSRVTAG